MGRQKVNCTIKGKWGGEGTKKKAREGSRKTNKRNAEGRKSANLVILVSYYHRWVFPVVLLVL